MGAGKSTVGRLIADALDWQLLDIDEEIEMIAGTDIPSIFEVQGEDGFRDYEAQVLMQTSNLTSTIIPCGGGIVTSSTNVGFLKDQQTIWLDVSPEEAASRLEHSDHRPLLKGCENTIHRLQEILDTRQTAYAEAASIHINTGQRSPDLIVGEILKKLEPTND